MFSECLLSYVDEVLTAGIERHRDQPPAPADIPVSHREDPRPCVPHSSPRRGDVEDAADLADAGGRAAECSRGTVGCYHGQVYLVAFCIVLYFGVRVCISGTSTLFNKVACATPPHGLFNPVGAFGLSFLSFFFPFSFLFLLWIIQPFIVSNRHCQLHLQKVLFTSQY